ncbi:MAG: single-stranded DNA-binding protein [Acutalibacteraceae bacterium]|nr:single-stranded DNA-binding protein [Acutalibacteraceae bacterium]
MLNCAVIMGRLTADPELRQTPSGVSVTRFTVAVDRGYVKAGEERKADFINVVAWRQTAEFVSRYFQKGSMIAVQGSIQTGSYEKDGVKRYTVEISADNVSFCGSKSETGTSGAPSATVSTAAPSFSNGGINDFAAMADDDDLPF